jgi:uncharacterized membrane protein YgcG
MKKTTKLAIGAGVGLATIGTVAYFATRKSAAATKTGTGKGLGECKRCMGPAQFGLEGPSGFFVQQGHTYNLVLSTSWGWQQALSALVMSGWQIVSPENAPIQAKWLGASQSIQLAMPACNPSADPNQPWNWPCGVTITSISDTAPAPLPAPMPGRPRRPVWTTRLAKYSPMFIGAGKGGGHGGHGGGGHGGGHGGGGHHGGHGGGHHGHHHGGHGRMHHRFFGDGGWNWGVYDGYDCSWVVVEPIDQPDDVQSVSAQARAGNWSSHYMTSAIDGRLYLITLDVVEVCA